MQRAAVTKIILFAAASFVFLYCLLMAVLFVAQRQLLYLPTDAYDHDLPVLVLETNTAQLNVAIINQGKPKALIYFGGNAEPVIFNHKPFAELFADYTVYLVSYRGYGGSGGKPSERAFYADALLVHQAVSDAHESLGLMGRSLGSGVATYLASQRSIDFLILVTPFNSIQALVQKRLPFLPVAFLLKDKFDSKSRADKITAKTLVLIAEYDRIVPPRHSHTLAAAFAPESVETVIVNDANHNSISTKSRYRDAILSFIGRVQKSP